MTIATPNRDAFDLLGLLPRFELTAAEIQRAYLSRATAAHPDSAPDGAAEAGDGLSAALNEAKDALLDDERRANTLLARLGGPAPNQDRSLPPTLLMEVMEKRTWFEESKARGDEAAMEGLRSWADQQRTERMGAVAELFRSVLGSPGGSAVLPQLKRLRMELNAWRYIERMLEQVG